MFIPSPAGALNTLIDFLGMRDVPALTRETVSDFLGGAAADVPVSYTHLDVYKRQGRLHARACYRHENRKHARRIRDAHPGRHGNDPCCALKKRKRRSACPTLKSGAAYCCACC